MKSANFFIFLFHFKPKQNLMVIKEKKKMMCINNENKKGLEVSITFSEY